MQPLPEGETCAVAELEVEAVAVALGVADVDAVVVLVLEPPEPQAARAPTAAAIRQVLITGADSKPFLGDARKLNTPTRLNSLINDDQTMVPTAAKPAFARSTVALGADVACFAAFVLLGRENHGLDTGFGWFLTVLWPFLLGWSLAAVATRLYSAASGWARWVATWTLGVAAGLGLRVLFTGRATPLAFALVALVFVGLTTGGWRLVTRMLRRRVY